MEILKKLSQQLRKYRMAVIIFLLGVVLMLLPAGNSAKPEEITTEPNYSAETDIALELEEILSLIQGVGKVKVMITVAEGERIVYQTDENTSGLDTVIINGSDRVEQGLVQQKLPAIYQGAIVVCQGADRAGVRLAVVEAVSKATGLGTDRISVLKMN